MGFDKKYHVALCLGLIAALLAVRPLAAEEPEKTEKVEKKKKEPFKIKVTNFDKMRDPFTFFVRVVEDSTGGIPIDRRLLDEALDKYKIAERYFKERRFKDAELACSDGLEKTNEIKDPKDATLQAYEEIVAKLTRLKKASSRMIKRYETEDALEKLKLEVSGVFAKVQTPQALVSFNSGTGATSMIVRIGDKILDTGAKLDPGVLADAPTVREIQPRRVIIDFRGYKIDLPISNDMDTTELVETPK
jgi:hypothetical protein